MIPCCFHPTRVVVVDDNAEFLEHINRHLTSEHSTYQFFSNPQKALHHLNEVYQPSPFPNRYIKNVDEERWEHRRLDVNIFDTHHELYRPERFQEISTLIVDHSMPGMTGIELLSQIKDPNIQKILLTGADEHLAIRAFNASVIDRYIPKQAFDMTEQLNQATESAQWRYFNRLSEVPLKAITSVNLVNHAIDDPGFQEFFKKLVKQYNFKEAYLCETMGSYIFLTEDASIYGLVVNSADQLDVTLEAAEAINVESSLVEALKNREKMMYCHNREGSFEPLAKDWSKHVYTPQILQGKQETYYYIFAPNLFDVDQSRILPFSTYKAKRGQAIYSINYSDDLEEKERTDSYMTSQMAQERTIS